MQTTFYWIIEYFKVLVAYGFIMFVWPSVVFGKFLKGKSKTFRFGFCSTASVIISTTLVLLLGLLHILRPWVLVVIYYGSFAAALIIRNKDKILQINTYRKIVTGTYKTKSLVEDLLRKTIDLIAEGAKKCWTFMSARKTEYFFLLAIVLWGVLYFSWGSFHDFSYGFGDQYVHHKWIFGLANGEIFVDGIYPEGMHCFVLLINSLFGIDIYSALLFVACIHTFTFFIGVYMFLKEVFNSRYTIMIVLMLFLTLDVVCIDEVYSMSRLQWTLPQEFGFYAVLMCGTFLLRYLKDDTRISWKKLWNENLLVFMLSIATTLSVHYYTTIIAFFVCLVIIIPYLNKVFKWSNFKQLAVTVILALVIAVTPVAGALLEGYMFQGSIEWALSVIENSDPTNTLSLTKYVKQPDEEEGVDVNQNIDETIESTKEEEKEPEPEIVTTEPVTPMQEEAVSLSFKDKVKNKLTSIYGKIRKTYLFTYNTMYKEDRARLLMWFTCFGAALSLLCTIVFPIIEKKSGRQLPKTKGYIIIILISVFFMVMYNPTGLGVPSIIAGSRLCAFNRIWNLAVVCLVLDMIGALLISLTEDTIVSLLAMTAVVLIYIGALKIGVYRGFLYYELTRYNSAVMTTKSIIDRLPDDSFTVVSTVDELYTVIEKGYHEETLDFVNSMSEDTCTIPTEYVFFYVEKHPIVYAQNHFFTGPVWFATKHKYYKYYYERMSEGNNILKGDLYETDGYSTYEQSSLVYSVPTSRVQVESELMHWCKDFMRRNPGEMHVYFEDENFVCYYLKQNPRALYELVD